QVVVEGGFAVALAQHAFDHMGGQDVAGGVVAAKALGVEEAHVQRLLVARNVGGGDLQVILVHVVGDPVDGLDAGNQTVLERAEGGDQLVGAGRGQGVADISLDGCHRPPVDAKRSGGAVRRLRIGGAVGWGAGPEA